MDYGIDFKMSCYTCMTIELVLQAQTVFYGVDIDFQEHYQESNYDKMNLQLFDTPSDIMPGDKKLGTVYTFCMDI